MPELPEVETIRRQLEARLPGRTIAAVDVLDPLLVSPQDPEAFAASLRGRRITSVGRRGKYLTLGLEPADTLALHLRMTGRILWTEDGAAHDTPHLRAVIRLDDGAALEFSDMRRFGRAWLAPTGPDAAAYWAARAGIEPLSGSFTAARLEGLLRGRRAPVKAALLNQALVAGIGNIYADEALFQARVHPLRPAGTLSAAEVRRLHRAIRDRLRVAVDAGGSSINRYRDGLGRPGGMQDLLRVHLRAGEPCRRCGTELVKIRVAGRGTYLCPRCQPMATC
jgi:formamidopyrimidine-DNA glycosylase